MFFVKGLSLFFLIIEGKASSICNWYFISVSVCWRRILVRPNNKLKTVLVGIFVAAQVVIGNEDMLWFLVRFLVVDLGGGKFQWRYDRPSGNCILSNCKLTRKNVGNSGKGIRTHGLCVSAAVLYQLSYEDPYIVGSRLICWVHLNSYPGYQRFLSCVRREFSVLAEWSPTYLRPYTVGLSHERRSREKKRAGHYKDLTETGNCARKVSGTQGT